MDKEKISKVLLIASAALMVVAFFTLFAPAFNVAYKDGHNIVGTGIMTSFLTVLLRIRGGTTFTLTLNDGTVIPAAHATGVKSGPFPYIIFGLIALAVLIGIATLILIFTKKYNGKVRTIMSIATWVILLAAVALTFLSSVLLDARLPDEFKKDDVLRIGGLNISLAIGPILYGICGALALGSNVVSYFLDRE